jgi:hypothetical protein
MTSKHDDSLIEDLKLIRDVKIGGRGNRRQSDAALRTASFAKDDRRAGSIGRIKLIEVVKVAKPKSRNDENIYQNHQSSPLRCKDSLSKKNS